MAKVNDNGFLSGHIGQIVYRELNGMQVAQAMPSQYHDAKSEAQLKQRSGMRNILATYRLLKAAIKEQFEEATSMKRPYNCFVHHNLLLPAIELSKKDYDMRLGLLAPYIVSHGSLPPLDIGDNNDTIQFQMKAEDWKPLDVLRLIRIESKESSADTPTHLKAMVQDTIINKVEDKIIVSTPLPHGAYTFVHLRQTRKGFIVSTQHLSLL